MIYLDYQATTPIAPEAREAMLPWLSPEGSANPHSPHAAGRAAKAAIELAREQVSALLPAGGHVFFTSGATEAANWALNGINNSGGIVLLETEHACVRDTALHLHASGREVTMLPVDQSGMASVSTNLPDGTALFAAMLVNNEIGVIQPIDALAHKAHEAGAVFFCDAVQGYGRVAIPDNCDLIAISAHKIHGPKGIGALWVRDGISLAPFMHGGGQEGGLRSGTLSPALCAGFGTAAALAAKTFRKDAEHVENLWSLARNRLGANWILNGSTSHRYKGNLNIRRAGLDASRIISDLRELAISAGSACASGSGRPSHVLTSLGLTRVEANASLRIGFGRYTTATELTDAIDQICDAANRQLVLAA
jgi:cysteine desulfurase